MRFIPLCATVLVAVSCGSSGKPHPFRIVARPDGDPGPIYKLEWRDSKTAKPIALGYYQPEQLPAPNGRMVAFGGEVELKIVDLVHRRAYVPRIGDGCSATPLLWKRQHRLILTLWCGGAHDSTRSEVLVLDPIRRQFIGRREIGLASSETAHGQVVLLTTPPLGDRVVPGTGIREELEGPARFLRVRADGHVDEIRLPIRMGSANSRTFNRGAAFVLDAKRRHAFVIGEGEGCARVDLRTLRVEWHRLPHGFDPQPRLASKPHPHQGTTNPSRDLDRGAVWLGDGKIGVTGEDTWSPGGFDRTAPAGLKILDTRRWTVRMIDPLVSMVEVVRGRLLATGPQAGLGVYDLKGRLLLRRFGGRQVWIDKVRGGLLHVAVRTHHVETNPKLDRVRKTTVDLP